MAGPVPGASSREPTRGADASRADPSNEVSCPSRESTHPADAGRADPSNEVSCPGADVQSRLRAKATWCRWRELWRQSGSRRPEVQLPCRYAEVDRATCIGPRGGRHLARVAGIGGALRDLCGGSDPANRGAADPPRVALGTTRRG